MVCPDPEVSDKTTVLSTDQHTLNREMQRAAEQEACLIVIRGQPQGHRFLLTDPEMTIGREATAEIMISDPSISRNHAKITKAEGRVNLTDLGSSNGTVVNGRKLNQGETVELSKEDMIKLGNTILKYLPRGALESMAWDSAATAANTDPLTKISNKGYLLQALEAEFKRARALHGELSLLFFDIDHFKKVNDTHGHEAGDYVLKEFTHVIRGRFVGPKDVFARYGGEEFVIILTNKNASQAQQIAEQVRVAVETHVFIYEGKKIPITSSVGVAELTAEIDSSASLIKKADKALYASKENGRNRVTVAS